MHSIKYSVVGGLAVTLCLTSAVAWAQDGRPQQVLPEGIRGGSEVVPEPGVEIRTYLFPETEKYSPVWAGAALLAPALFDVELTEESNILDVPLMVAIGDQDSLLESSREFGERLASLHATYRYQEFAGLDHGTIIMGSMPEVFEFFAKHTK